MELVFVILNLIICLSAACAEVQYIRIQAKSLTDNNIIRLGTIEYDQSAKTANFNQNEVLLVSNNDYCVGTEDLKNQDCFTYTYLAHENNPLQDKQFVLHLDNYDRLNHISLCNGGKDKVIVQSVIAGPVPNMNPASMKKNSIHKKQVVKRTVKDQDGNQIEIEEEVEEDNRSWIQKNWIYLVAPLIIFLLLTDDKK